MYAYLQRLTAFLLLAAGATASVAQTGSRLELFYGGIISSEIDISSSGLFALSGTFPGAGAAISQLRPGGESVRWNPAGLAYMKKSLLYSEYVPPIALNLNTLLDVENRVNTTLRDNTARFAAADSLYDQRDSSIRPKISLSGGQGTYAAIVKTRYFSLGGAVHHPVRLATNFAVSGMKFRAATQAAGGGTTLRLLGVLNGTFASEFILTGYALAVGGKLGRGFALGLGFDSFSATLESSGVFRPEAQISSGSQEFVFNSPQSSHYDSLGAETRGAFFGDGARIRLGFGWHKGDRWAVDVAWFAPYDIVMSGALTLRYDRILAFNLSAEEGSEFFDAGQLLDDDFTGTHPRQTRLTNLRLSFPGRLGIALSGQWRNGSVMLVYERYQSALGLAFAYASTGDSTFTPLSGEREYRFAPKNALSLAAGAEWLQLQLGVASASFTTVHSRENLRTRRSFLLYTFSISGGFTIPHFRRMRMDYAVGFGVTSFLRFGFSYTLE